MPGLERSQQLQVRAARVGFDWSDISGVFDKVREELSELEKEESKEKRTEELAEDVGDHQAAVETPGGERRWQREHGRCHHPASMPKKSTAPSPNVRAEEPGSSVANMRSAESALAMLMQPIR